MRRVLIIDDEPGPRGYLRALLPDDIDVLEAVTAQEGLAIVTTHVGKLALIILDIKLPDLDGRSLALAIRRLDPVVRIQPFTSTEQSLRVLAEVGCLPTIYKMLLTDDQLRATLRAALESTPTGIASSGIYEFASELVSQQVQRVMHGSGGRRVAVGIGDPVLRQFVLSELSAFAPTTVVDSPRVLRTLLQTVAMTALVVDGGELSGFLQVARAGQVAIIVVATSAQQALQIGRGTVVRVLHAADSAFGDQLRATINGIAAQDIPEHWATPPVPLTQVVPAEVVAYFATFDLRDRWLDVLWLDYQGQSTRQIAELFTITPATVDDYWKKLGRHRGQRKAELQAWFRTELEGWG